MPSTRSKEEWDTLVFGSFALDSIRFAVKDQLWRDYRVYLLGMSNDVKFEKLKQYVAELDQVTEPRTMSSDEWEIRKLLRKIRVTNYVNALRRGGLIP